MSVIPRHVLSLACLAVLASPAVAQPRGAAPASTQAAPAGAAPAIAAPAVAAPLTHAEAMRLMLEHNRQVGLARRALDVAASEIPRVDVLPNPTVSAQLSNTQAREYRVRDSDRILRIEQLFERGGKRELRAGVARAGEQAARMELADVTRQQRAALAGAYYDLLGAQQLLRIAQQNADGYARLVDAAERRLRAGDIASVDVARLRVEASRAANDARAAQGALADARVTLAAVLGLESQAARLQAVDDFPALDAPDPSLPPSPERIEDALRARPDVAAARARVEAFARARTLAEQLRTRDVTIGVQAERAPSYGGTVLGISASIPLFVNNDYRGDIQRAHAEHAQALEDEQRVRGAVVADIDRTAAQVSTALDRARRIAQDALPDAQRAAEGIEFAFARGAATLTDLFDARRQLAAVQAESIRARADFARTLVAYREALATRETR